MTIAFHPAVSALHADGFALLPELLRPAETAAILVAIAAAPATGPGFRRSQDLFAIRNVLGEVPALQPLLAASALPQLLAHLFPEGCHLVKSIYFDKPAHSNWFVAWHQDLMISVSGQTTPPGFGPWTRKAEGVAVQPPRPVLENICTIRLHLDDCAADNGALRVVPGSHLAGPLPAGLLAPAGATAAVVCAVPAGGAMLMKPLLLHASQRSSSPRPRRVLHLEFSSLELPPGLQWRERLALHS